jgi:hypothetical protein
MTNKQLMGRSLINTVGLAVYVFAVANIMQNGEKWFGRVPGLLGPTAFLMLFVLSAAVSGSLVFGKPILVYLDGDKKGAVVMVLYTMLWLTLFVALALLGLATFR